MAKTQPTRPAAARRLTDARHTTERRWRKQDGRIGIRSADRSRRLRNFRHGTTKELRGFPYGGTARKLQDIVAQSSLPRRPRALIVEDEIMIALDLEETMLALGFESCGLASSDRRARSLAMTDQPDVVLMDVCLEGGREGIETARWLHEVCGASVVFVTANGDKDTLARIRERVPGAPILSKPVYRKQLAKAVSEAIQ